MTSPMKHQDKLNPIRRSVKYNLPSFPLACSSQKTQPVAGILVQQSCNVGTAGAVFGPNLTFALPLSCGSVVIDCAFLGDRRSSSGFGDSL